MDRQPIVPVDTTPAKIVYALYGGGFLLAPLALAGLVYAYLLRGRSPLLDTHLAFQIRTFWIGLALTVAGTLLTLVLVGYVVLAFWFVWTLARVISGFLLLNRGEPIRGTEWFGAVAR